MRGLNDLQELTLLSLNVTDVVIGAIENKINKTQDLNVMNWEQANMDDRRDKILEGGKVEHEKFLKYKV